MKKYIIQVTIFSTLILSVLIFVNYTIDPAALFNIGGEEEKAARLMADGDITTNLDYLNERVILKKYIEDPHRPLPQHIAIGSSRALMLSSRHFNDGRTFFNSSVNGASMEDFEMIYWMWFKSGAPLERVTLEVSMNWFNTNYINNRWEVYKPEYPQMLKDMMVHSNNQDSPIINPRLSQLVSITYFQNSVDNLMIGIGTQSAEATDSLDYKKIRYPDGSYRYPYIAFQEKELDQGLLRIWLEDNGLVFNTLDQEKCDLFKSLIYNLINRRIKVDLFLNCYHPDFYPILCEKSPAVERFLSFINEFAAETPGVSIVGSFDPTDYNLGHKDFFDVVHPKEIAYDRIFGVYPTRK